MNIPYEVVIGLRYTRAGRRARRRNAFISFISAASMAGIALGVMALIVVLSVMNGFQREVRDRMLSVLPHIEIQSISGTLPDWRTVAQKARKDPEVLAAAPVLESQAMFVRDGTVRGALVEGVDPALEPSVSEVLQRLQGAPLSELRDGEFGIVLGIDLARSLGVGPGDKVTMVAPQGTFTPAGILPRVKQFRVLATFESGHYEYDSALAMVHLDDAQRVFRQDGPNAVRLRLVDMQRAPEVARRMAGTFGDDLWVRDWTSQNKTWFAAVKVEKRMMFVILTLIVAVAAFNLVSTLVMTVTEKRSDIAILRTLGASPVSILSIFVIQGGLIGVLGTLLGVGSGLLLACNLDVIVPAIERTFGVHFLDPSIYFISALPSDPRAADIVPIALISLLLSLVATLYPSWRAARVQPAEELRYD
ncbi:MAG TPA: lipoprotein-releasing ABC transporter permease subunit [Burkholderiaceae bacterium]|nr:lipoprotein-releasing ABC transporter permease subunit [Burkholderiaceae bacterium]